MRAPAQFLVLPAHASLDDFVDSYSAWDHVGKGPLIALRTSSAWALFNLTGTALNIVDVNVTHFVTLPIVRGAPGGREKYLLNASAREPPGVESDWTPGAPLHNLNLHGVYHAQAADEGAHVRIFDRTDARWPAYHLHFLNTRAPERTQDSREVFLNMPKLDVDVADFVRRAIVRRQRNARARAEVV